MKKNLEDMLAALSSGPVQKFLKENENTDVYKLVLANRVLFSVPAANLSEQITTRRKAKEKLPLFFETPGIVYPPSSNFEQCSSQQTALYKSDLMSTAVADAASCVDLTGGFGVDSFFFSQKLKKIFYVEPDAQLLELARHNHKLLGAQNIEHHLSSAEEFLDATSLQYDFIFIDPSRRRADGKKVYGLSDSLPNVIALQDKIFEHSKTLLVKASPLMDLQAGIFQLKGVKELHVVAINNECRELLFLCERHFAHEPAVVAVNLPQSGPPEVFRFSFREEQEQEVSFEAPSKFLYEPNAAIMKAGAFKTLATRFGLKKLAPSTHLYSGPELIDGFPGRTFRIEKMVKPEPAELRLHFPEGKANVATRNYPLSPEALKKKTRLTDGGEKYLLGFSGMRQKYLAVAQRIQ